MKYILSIIITFVTLLSAQELPGFSIYIGAGMGSATFDDSDAREVEYETALPFFGFSKGLNVGVPLILNVGFGKRSWSESAISLLGGSSKYIYNLDYLDVGLLMPYQLGPGFAQIGILYGSPLGGEVTAEIDNNEKTMEVLPYNMDPDYGLQFAYLIPVTENINVSAGYYYGLADHTGGEKFNSLSFNVGYAISKSSGGTTVGMGPSAKPKKESSKKSKKGSSKKSKKSSAPKRPAPVGNSQIDNFINSAFDLNDKLLALKTKLDGVSSGLKESNAIIAEISNYPDGPTAWASSQLAAGTSKAMNNLKSINVSAGMDGLNPGQQLRSVLQTLKSGISDGKDELATVPNDLATLASEATNLISSAAALPGAAASLGLKAPKALKAIGKATGVIKNVPKEVASITKSTKNVIDEIGTLLKNIQDLLAG